MKKIALTLLAITISACANMPRSNLDPMTRAMLFEAGMRMYNNNLRNSQMIYRPMPDVVHCQTFGNFTTCY